jgi:hypothetical protein
MPIYLVEAGVGLAAHEPAVKRRVIAIEGALPRRVRGVVGHLKRGAVVGA